MNFAMILLIRIDCTHLPFKDGRWGRTVVKVLGFVLIFS